MPDDYSSQGTPVGIGEPNSINGFSTKIATATDDESPYEIITYWQCTGDHITIHTGHTDTTTMMSVEDGSVETTIPCGSSNAPNTGGSWMYGVQPGTGFLDSVPPDFTDRVDVGDSTFVVATMQGSDDQLPPLSIWSTAACDGAHVVMHYGHEDSVSGTSVYDGSVTTTIPCAR